MRPVAARRVPPLAASRPRSLKGETRPEHRGPFPLAGGGWPPRGAIPASLVFPVSTACDAGASRAPSVRSGIERREAEALELVQPGGHWKPSPTCAKRVGVSDDRMDVLVRRVV